MKSYLLLFFSVLIIYSANAQERNTRLLDNFKVQHYLIRDSLGIFIIKETVKSDGSRSYSVIPKSHLEQNLEPLEENYPSALLEWFNREKSSILRQKRSQMYTGRKSGVIDTTGAYVNKSNTTVWWILGSTALLGGVTAYYFLQTKDNQEELPIQPNPPK
jgi:hypothetical protein